MRLHSTLSLNLLIKFTLFVEFALFQNDGIANGLSQPVGTSQQSTKKPILILGLGQVGLAVAEAAQHSYSIVGTVQEAEENGDTGTNNDVISGVQTIVFSKENLETVFPACSSVLVTIPPPIDQSDSDALNIIYDNMVDLMPKESWIGVLSTTGIYGHHDGEWVDEDSELLGKGESATRYQTFESEWQSRVSKCNRNHTLNIFRCAGIYGWKSSALHTLYRKGLPPPAISKGSSAKGVTNRIHIADITRAILSAISRNSLGNDNNHECRIYNLSDDLPESRDAVMQCAADLFASINVSLEPEVSNGSLPGGRAARRDKELKLVSNRRLKEELLPDGLKYPTYFEGLQAILMLPNMPWSTPNPK